MHRDGADRFYLHDHLYSPAALLDAGGTVSERYEYDAYGKATVWNANFTSSWNVSQVGNPYTFTGRRLDSMDAGNWTSMHYRHRDYDPITGRFIQHDPLGIVLAVVEERLFMVQKQYNDGMNLYGYSQSKPVIKSDSYGLWAKDIHYTATKQWSMQPDPGPKFPKKAAKAIARANHSVDNIKKRGGTGPVPWGDYSYHFNRNLDDWSNDTRRINFMNHFTNAKRCCLRGIDNPEEAAEELGTSLHPLQDWVAHGDYGKYDRDDIFVVHNSMSPDDPEGKFPDDPDLDALNGPYGRPAGNAMIWSEYKSIKDGKTQTKMLGYAIYVKGHHRRSLTRRMTHSALNGFRVWVEFQGGCKCREYFGIK